MKYLPFILLFLLWTGSRGTAQPNGFDLSFGNNGMVITGNNSSNYGSGAFGNMLVQPDGKIVAVGGSVIRYNSNGTIDAGFADQGIFATDVFGFYDAPGAVAAALQPDGKILIGGNVDTVLMTGTKDYFAWRLNTDGTLDSSFGYQGHVICDLDGRLDNMTSMALQPDGKILMAGYCRVWNSIAMTTRNEIGIVRLMPDGQVDTTFGVNGWAHRPTTMTSYGSRLAGISLMTDGRIVVGGDTYVDGSGEWNFYTARFLANGSTDSSFNQTGLFVVSGLGDYYCHGIATQPDGRIIALGDDSRLSHLQILRWNIDGTPDASFNGNAASLFSDLGVIARWRTCEIMPDGKILVAGSIEMPVKKNFILTRLNQNGTMDSTFGDQGKLINPLRIGGDEIFDLAIQADGKILAAGSSINGTGDWPDIYSDKALVRYNEDGQLPIRDNDMPDISISIFPNPATNDIQILNPGKLRVRHIQMITSDGRIVQEYNNTTRINVSQFAAGKYYLAISIDDITVYKPVVIRR